jgi:hypothetical protein
MHATLDKQSAIAVLWAVIVIIVASFFHLRRTRPVKTPPIEKALHPSSCKSDKFCLITLNGIIINSDSMELIQTNILAFRLFSEFASKNSRGLVAIFTIPSEYHENSIFDASEKLKTDVESLLKLAESRESGLKGHRIVFTSSAESRISIGRQVEAGVFLDSDLKVVNELTGKVPSVVHITEETFQPYVMKHFLAQA